MFRLSFRFLLGLALVVVNVSLAAVVATFAYRAAHDAMVQQVQPLQQRILFPPELRKVNLRFAAAVFEFPQRHQGAHAR